MKNKISIFTTLLCLTACSTNTQTENQEYEPAIRRQSVTCYSGGSVIHHDVDVAVHRIEASGIWYTRSDGIRVRTRADCIAQDMKN